MNIITIDGLQEPVRIEVIDNPFTRLFIDHFKQVAACGRADWSESGL